MRPLEPARAPKVLHVIDNLGLGGAETWLMALFRRWRDAGPNAPQAEVLATGGGPGFYDDEARALGVTIHYAPFRRTGLPAFVGALRNILRVGRFDALHDHEDFTSGWHFLMGSGLLPPVRIAHVHNQLAHLRANYLTTPTRRLAAAAGRGLIARYATFVAGTSEESLAAYGFNRLKGPRGVVPSGAIYCGFDPRPFGEDREAARADIRREFGWPDEARIVLAVGRIDESPDPGHPLNQKNSGMATAIGIALARRDESVRMLFAGAESAATAVLRDRVREAGLEGRIVFAGVRRDVSRLMSASEALLFPSQTEGLGMVAVEAQAAGLPVLASSIVPRECVVAPDLVRFKDTAADVGQWADELERVMALPRDPAAANRQVARSPYAISNSAAALEALYAGSVPA